MKKLLFVLSIFALVFIIAEAINTHEEVHRQICRIYGGVSETSGFELRNFSMQKETVCTLPANISTDDRVMWRHANAVTEGNYMIFPLINLIFSGLMFLGFLIAYGSDKK